MCQVTPFTLPCCRRIYVQVEKLPSCPDNWPRRKCPKELCIQLSGYEAADVEQREEGMCWRCFAERTGQVGYDREGLRPGIDKAFIVEGLEELPIGERRSRLEEAGICWFCDAKKDCEGCGKSRVVESGVGGSVGMRSRPEGVDIKGKGKRKGKGEVKAGNKRLKAEDSGSSISTPSSMVSSPAMFEQQFPDPSIQPYTNTSGGVSYTAAGQTISNFNPFNMQALPYHNGIPQSAIGDCYDRQDVQRRGFYGSRPESEQQGQHQSVEGFHMSNFLPQEGVDLALAGFGADINLDDFEGVDDTTLGCILSAYNDQIHDEIFNNTGQSNQQVAKISDVSQIDPSLVAMKHEHTISTS